MIPISIKKAQNFLWKKIKVLDVSKSYWLESSEIDIDSNEEFCYSCAEKKVEELKKKYPDKDIYIRGGWSSNELDSCCHCLICGHILKYSLTPYGVKQELDHFEKHKFDITSAEECYHLDRVLESYAWYNDKIKERIESLAKKIDVLS